MGRFCPRRGNAPLKDLRGRKRGLVAQGSGFPLTSRELVMVTTTGKTPSRVWLPRFPNMDILVLRQIDATPLPKALAFVSVVEEEGHVPVG